jgi:hypothetical protein
VALADANFCNRRKQSLVTSCQRVCVPRWKPMPMQFTTVASVSMVAKAVVDPESLKTPEPVACSFVSEIRLSQVQSCHAAEL